VGVRASRRLIMARRTARRTGRFSVNVADHIRSLSDGGGLMFRLLMGLRYFLWRIFGSSPFGGGGHSTEPLTEVREPNRGKPGGKSSAIALREPEGNGHLVNAVANFRKPFTRNDTPPRLRLAA